MKKLFFLISISLVLVACNNSTEKNNTENTANNIAEQPYSGNKTSNNVIIHELSDPDKLNPLTSQGAGSNYIEHAIFMYLLDIDKVRFISHLILIFMFKYKCI